MLQSAKNYIRFTKNSFLICNNGKIITDQKKKNVRYGSTKYYLSNVPTFREREKARLMFEQQKADFDRITQVCGGKPSYEQEIDAKLNLYREAVANKDQVGIDAYIGWLTDLRNNIFQFYSQHKQLIESQGFGDMFQSQMASADQKLNNAGLYSVINGSQKSCVAACDTYTEIYKTIGAIPPTNIEPYVQKCSIIIEQLTNAGLYPGSFGF